jgi:hypothetical protein
MPRQHRPEDVGLRYLGPGRLRDCGLNDPPLAVLAGDVAGFGVLDPGVERVPVMTGARASLLAGPSYFASPGARTFLTSTVGEAVHTTQPGSWMA